MTSKYQYRLLQDDGYHSVYHICVYNIMEEESIVEREEQKPVMDSNQSGNYNLVDFSLEEVEEEIRLEKIRQTSVKFSWDYLSQLLRRNLMEKRFVLSADDKEDLMRAAADMRKHMPSDTDRDLSTHLRHLAESLSSDFQAHIGYYKIRNADFSLEIAVSADGQQITSCSVSWFGERAMEAQALRLYISRNRWDLVHIALTAMFHLIPSDLSRDEKIYCLRSLEYAEKDLLNLSGNTPSIFEQINSGILGLCKPRTESTPFTIYPFVEPVIFFDPASGNIISPTDEQVLYDVEPYLQLCIVSNSTPNFFSDAALFVQGDWRTAVSGRQLPAAFCLRFSRPIIFSSAAIKKLSKIASVQLNVEGSYNLYQYLLNESEERHDLFVRLPGCATQHYIFDNSMMCSREDGILRQIPFAHLQDVIFLVNIIRTQLAHNSFFESLIRAHSRSACVDENIVDIHIASSYIDFFDLQFYLKKNLFIARVSVSPSNINVSLECVINGAVLPESQHATAILAKSWSLAVMMRSVLRRGGAISLAALEKPFVMNENVDNNCDVKISQSWLFVPNITDSNINYNKTEHEYVVDERINFNCSQDSSLGRQSPLSLLALFKELEKIEELIPPQKPLNGAQQCTAPPRNEMLAPRTSRIHSENTMTINAFSVLEKRFVLSADDKEDLMRAAADMRKHMPSDTDRDLSTHLRHLAESLSSDFQAHIGYYKIRNADFSLEIAVSADGQQITSCSVSWFGERAMEAQALRLYISRNRWDLVHIALTAMFHLIPSDLSRDEKIYCLRSLEYAEKDLLNLSGNTPSIFEQINSGILGLCKPRTESTPFTIYPFVEPVIFFDPASGNIISPTDEQVLYDVEPYLQLCIVSNSTPNFFSDAALFVQGDWRTAVSGRQLPAAFCLRFSRPIIFSSAAIKKLSKIASVQLNVEGSYNLYQYLLNESEERHDLFVRLPGCATQHYIFDNSMMCSREDGILRQIPFAHLQDVIFLVNIIRTQLAHNSFFESLIRAHSRSACVDENIVDIHIASSYIDFFDLQFYLKKNLFIARVSVSPSNINVSLECVINGAVLPESQHATAILAKSWSLAVMMRSVLRRGGAISLAALEKPFVMNENVDNNCDVKISQSWLFVPNITDSNINYNKTEHEYVVDERINFNCSQDSSLGRQSPLSLLALFKELEKIEELIPPQKPLNGAQQCTAPPRNEMLAPRTSRIHSENTMTINAFSVLDAICDMAASIDDGESNISEHSSHSSIVERCSPSTNESQRLRPQMPSQSPSPASERYRASQTANFSQLSPLDIARQRLAQQAPMSNPTDIFEFDDPPRMTSASSMGSSAQQFHFPEAGQSSYPFAAMQSTRGPLSAQPTLKRRGRGRKAGNVGDRMLDPSRPILDQNTGLIFRGINIPARKPRGTSTTRRPRRPRKAAHMPASPAHPHQFAINRPMLQRSFSEMPTYPSQMPPVNLSQENRSEVSEFDGTEESSDDETDPPPPVCTATIPQPSAQLTGSSGTPLPQTATVSNLSSSSAPLSLVNKSSSLITVSCLPSISSSGAATELASPTSSSPISTNNSSLQSASLLAHKARKGSLEAVVGKLHCKTAPASSSSSTASNPYLASDLYDDESEPVAKPPEPLLTKRDSPSILTSSPGARMSPNLTKINAEQPGYGSELKIMIKLKQQASTRLSTGSSQSSSGGVPSSMRLVGQPPSSSRSKEEKALLRQKQLKEKNRSAPDERARKAGKRERKGELSNSKKLKLDRPLSEQKTTTTVSPRVEFPQALAFASLKNFKIPKVMENEKCESPTPTTTTTPAVATPSSSGAHLNINQNPGSSTTQTVSSTSLSVATTIAVTTVPSSSSSVGTSSIFPPKPKSILKSSTEPPPPPLFRGMGGVPPMLPGRRPLLPDPRNVMHHPPRPLVTLPRMIPSVLGGANFMPPPSSSGRWMALAPQRQPSPRNSPSEQSASSSGLSDTASAISKMQDSPTEALKIVADEE
ncbi:Mediator of RNA polymerase II transcription subunit [Dirofilaria immitis]